MLLSIYLSTVFVTLFVSLCLVLPFYPYSYCSIANSEPSALWPHTNATYVGVYLCVALLLVAVLVSVLMKNMMAVGLCAPLLLVAMQYADQLKPSQSKEHAS